MFVAIFSVCVNRVANGVLIELVACKFNPIITLRDNAAVPPGFFQRTYLRIICQSYNIGAVIRISLRLTPFNPLCRSCGTVALNGTS